MGMRDACILILMSHCLLLVSSDDLRRLRVEASLMSGIHLHYHVLHMRFALR